EDRSSLPLLEPEVARHLAVVLIGLAIAVLPRVELAGAHAQPADQSGLGKFGSLRPAFHVIDHLVAGVVGDPLFRQRSPSSFFSCTCSCISSAITSFLLASLASSRATFWASASSCRRLPDGLSNARTAWARTSLTQLWIRLGCKPNSSARLLTGSLPARCRRTISAFCSA